MSGLPTFTEEEVASHVSQDSIWFSIDGKVYDVTDFLEEHPGGQEVLLENAGKDASSAFADIGHSQDAVDLRETYLIGALESTTAPLTRTPPQGSTVLEAESTTAPPLPRDPEQEAESAATLRGQKDDQTCCSGSCRARAWQIGAVVVGVAAVAAGAYLAYKALKK